MEQELRAANEGLGVREDLIAAHARDSVAVGAITSEAGDGSGVPHGDALVRLVDATVGRDDEALADARRAVVVGLGPARLVDAAAIIGTFAMQNRVADATGLPLDAPIELATRGLRAELGADRFGAADRTPRGGWAHALVARVEEPLVPTVFRWLGRR